MNISSSPRIRTITIANKTISIQFYPAKLCPPQWMDDFKSHSCEGTEDFDAQLLVNPRPNWYNLAPGGAEIEYNSESNEKNISLQRHDFSGTLKKKSSGQFFGEFDVRADGIFPLAILLRTCLSFLCEESDELVLHASSVTRNEKTWLFCGPSESGKTTIATKFSGGGVPLAVDISVLSLLKDDSVIVHSTPFSDLENVVSKPGIGVLHGIILIEQALHNELVALAPRQAVSRLSQQTLMFSRSAPELTRLLSFWANVTKRNPCYLLKFENNDSFWQLLDQV